MKLPVLVIAAAAAVGLAGCAAGPSVAPQIASTAPRAVVTPTPSASASAIDPAHVATWTISASGVGPVNLGMPIDDAVRAMSPALVELPAPAGCSVPTLRFLGPAGTSSSTAPVMLVPSRTDGVAEIMISMRGPATVDHLGVGSSAASVTAAHPDAEASMRAEVDPLLTIVGDPGSISFESTETGADAPVTIVWLVQGHYKPEPEYCGS